ncbi:MAG TPA: helix-hairpin-helix domain-containing protein, partial [Brevibacterium sp.]|nr:helix-hairpin-helix domain-containing protein [Brevibacterium sp.]
RGELADPRPLELERLEGTTRAELTSDYLRQAYGDVDPQAVPPEVLVDVAPDDPDAMGDWLRERRGGRRVTLRVPERGEKRAVLDTVAQNAEQSLALHRTRRASDLTTRSEALREVHEVLGLDEPPLRIECIDNSHTQGQDVVGSLIVFEDGLPKKRDYRHFSVRGEAARDDTAAMYDVVSRRFSRYLESLASDDPDERFGYRPSLLLVDGGPPQVSAARRALDDLGLPDIAVAGLAKRLEEVWLPGDDHPTVFPRSSEGLYLLQRIRDEAHRVAISYHRRKRAASAKTSALDAIPGLGPTRRRALLKTFGSVARIRKASVEELQEVHGVGAALAATIHAGLKEGAAQDGS